MAMSCFPILSLPIELVHHTLRLSDITALIRCLCVSKSLNSLINDDAVLQSKLEAHKTALRIENPMKDPDAVKVKEWRHKIQRTFLPVRDVRVEEMPSMDVLFTAIESYDKMIYIYLKYSKISKVMERIARLGEERIPRDAEFRFRQRASALVDRWKAVLDQGKDSERASQQVTSLAAGNGASADGPAAWNTLQMAQATSHPGQLEI